ncbi:uncharacterized protein LOC131960910 [Centropristis striata]|uniref:uncharacterized protein LOC131960910 n=1 Tax=Centropristis striata TaxID=184440 RepID=UPI0027E0F351|nr:uncharacterized protein LOC131960910 [Centropristis striata]
MSPLFCQFYQNKSDPKDSQCGFFYILQTQRRVYIGYTSTLPESRGRTRSRKFTLNQVNHKSFSPTQRCRRSTRSCPVDLPFCGDNCGSTMVSFHRRRAAALLLLLARQQRRGRRRTSRHWVHPLNQRRPQQGDFYHLVAELRLDSQRHHQYFRMVAEQMDLLLSIIGPEPTRQNTNYRAAIEAKQRLAVGLRQEPVFHIQALCWSVASPWVGATPPLPWAPGPVGPRCSRPRHRLCCGNRLCSASTRR